MNGSAFIGEGLTVTTTGDIALNGVTANNNFLWGASLNAGGNVNITDSIFNGNTTESPGFIDDTGLLVTSGGDVSLLRVQANDNRLLGATINAQGLVTVNDSEFLSNNGVTLDSAGNEVFHGVGLEVVTLGDISVTGVNASGNTYHGALLDAGGNVQVTGSTFSNNSSLNNTFTGTPPATGKGLIVISDQSVILDGVTFDANQTFGAHVELQGSGAVFLDAVTATNNGANGVEVQANCTTVFLINGTYTNNQGYGLSVVTGQLISSGAPVFGGNVQGDTFVDPGTCIFSASSTSAGTLIPPADDGGTTPPTEEEEVPADSTDAMTDANPPYAAEPNLAAAVITSESSTTRGRAAWNAYQFSERSSGSMRASFLAKARLGGGSGLHIALINGKYAYVYYTHGKQVIFFLPSSPSQLAMGGS
jgi:hypothetical protein